MQLKLRNRQLCCLPTSAAQTALSHFTLQLKLRKMRNFCMRPARRIGDTGRTSSVPYVHQPSRILHLQKSILYCNCCYYKNAAELMNIRISGASELNGDAAREVNRA